MRAPTIAFVTFLSTLITSAAQALCIYDDVDNAKTTIVQEFKDSRLVVKAKVLSATNHFSDEDNSWTLYQLEVQHTYKGRSFNKLRFFTFRNSGGFYMDRAGIKLSADHDVGGEYLLFLNPAKISPELPPEARGSFFVNYSCGVSSPWSEVSARSRRELLKLKP